MSDWRLSGYTEAGIGVIDPDPWVRYFRAFGEWEVVTEGQTDPAILGAWGDHTSSQPQEVLLARPGQAFGQVRLFCHADPVPATNRSEAAAWDSGGIFDLDIRVADLSAWADCLENEGWVGVSEPVDWPFGDLKVREWLARGPQDVIIAHMQRVHPPLTDWAFGNGFSHAFNSSQIVADAGISARFYQHLGFKTIVEHHGPLGGQGGEVLGLSAESAPTTDVDLLILHPQGLMEGSVELVALPGVARQDLSGSCSPGRLGLNLLRFPVEGLDSWVRHIESKGLSPAKIFNATIDGIGAVRMTTLASPDNAWLEFYEPD